MHRISWQPYVLGALVTVISTGMLLYGWDNIPDTYATHFTAGGEANGFTNKGPGVLFGQYMAVGILTLGLALALPDTLPLPKDNNWSLGGLPHHRHTWNRDRERGLCLACRG